MKLRSVHSPDSDRDHMPIPRQPHGWAKHVVRQAARHGLRGDAVHHVVAGLQMDVDGLVTPADLDDFAVQRAGLPDRPELCSTTACDQGTRST